MRDNICSQRYEVEVLETIEIERERERERERDTSWKKRILSSRHEGSSLLTTAA